MNGLSYCFLLALALAVIVQLWLARRHITHVLAHRHRVPQAFAQRVTLETHQKAAAYTVARTRFEIVTLLYQSMLLLAWTLGGGLDWLDQLWRTLHWPALATGIAVILSILLITAMLDLPLRIYHIFVIEQRFGFNQTGPGLFTADVLRETLLTLLITTPLVALILWLMTSADGSAMLRPLWWLYVWLVWNAFSLLMLWIYPAFIAPLFNRFTPLGDEDLKTRIGTLLQRAGFTASGIFVMDSSRRSAHGNAFFSGLGRHKRIVFYDVLLNSLNADEIEAVLAHELGHFRHHHIHKRLIATALLSLTGLLILDVLLGQSWFFSGLGVSHPSPHLALPLFVFVAPVFTFFLTPLLQYFSRRQEFQADDYASHQAPPMALVSALLKLYEDNAATLTPDPLYSAFHDSHPPAPLRIASLLDKAPA